MFKGSCLCKSVTFTVTGSIPQPDACHCTQCRKFSGHFFASADFPRTAVQIEGKEHITWYPTETVQRGFCSKCGSSLFWDPIERDWIAIAMGAFDQPTQTTLGRHIFVAHKGDYYDISDGLPQDLRPPGSDSAISLS